MMLTTSELQSQEQELRELKRAQYEMAQKDGTIDACYLVGRKLGQSMFADCGPKYIWHHESIEIYVDDYGHYMTVHVDGKEVCSTHECGRLFVPGPWTATVLAFVDQARTIEQSQARRVALERVNRLRREFGLPEAE